MASFAAASLAHERMNEWTRALLDALDDAVFMHDLQGRIVEVNAAACRRLGYTREEFLRLTTRDIDAPEFARGFAERAQQQLEHGAFRCEGVHRTKDGRNVPVDINTSKITLDGQPAILAVMRDISERKNSERRLQAQYSVGQAIASGGTLAELAGVILQTLGQELDMAVAVLWVFEGNDQALRCCEIWHDLPDTPREFMTLTRLITIAAGVDVPGEVCLEGAAQARPLTEPETEQYSRRRLAWQAGLRGVAAFPIHSKLDVVGVLEFFSRSEPRLDEGLQSMMYALGGQIGQMLQRQRVEKALRDSEALYQSLVQSLPQNIYRKDCAGRVTFGNRHYCETLKLPLDKLLGKTDYDLFPVELARKYTADDQQVLKGQPFETVEEHHLPEGNTIFVHVIKTPVRDAQGEIVGTQGLFWDVTEKHRADQILAESELRYRQLTEATLDAIVLVDQSSRI